MGLIALAGVFLLTTSWNHYESHPLKAVATNLLPTFSLNDSRVVVVAKAMTSDESKRNFGHDLISRGVQPLHLTIENNTSNEYSLCPSSVDLPRVEVSKIAFKITKSAIPRGIAFKIASFFFWPLAIPSTIDGIRVLKHHQNLKKDLTAKSMRDEVVAPYSTFNRVLFVPTDEFQDSFKVTLIELDTLKPTEFQTTVEGMEKTAEPVAGSAEEMEKPIVVEAPVEEVEKPAKPAVVEIPTNIEEAK
jgi:hypothetical protein